MTSSMINVALIFPGQGAQSVGMGREFYDTSKPARAVFDKADRVIKGLTQVIFNGPQEKLTSTAFCQPAIFTYSIAALHAFQDHPKFRQVDPKFAAGLSLGECTAVAASGALSFEEALHLVERRAFFMEEAAKAKKGAMTAVIGFDPTKLAAICHETGTQVANFNSPEQIVITGEAAKVAAACAKVKEQGGKPARPAGGKAGGRVIPLDVSGAFHSSLMAPAVPQFEAALKKADFKPPRFPVISNVNGRPTVKPDEIRTNLARQITSSVQWVDTVQYIAAQGVVNFLEIGPGNVLKGLIRKINPDLTVHNIRKPEDLDGLPF